VPDRKLRGSAGEHLVCGVLAQFNWAAALTREGVARTDVLAANAETGRTVSLQVKTTWVKTGRLANWLTDPSATPGTRNAPQAQARVDETVFVGYENRWDLLNKPTDDAPVLLPSWCRTRALEKRVGLPPGHLWHKTLPNW
jgi:hypothetical protein